MKIATNLVVCAVGLCVAVSAFGQGYPTKPVRMIVPFTAGSGVDVIGRMVGQKLSDFWGQPVAVENQVGAGGTVGAAAVAKAPSDGYTLLVNSTAHAVNAALYANLPYDPVKDFVAVSPLVAHGKLLALGVSSARRSSLLPDVPTIAEAGVSGFEDSIWYGVWAPAGTHAEVVDKLSKDIARALATPEVRERLTKSGTEAMSMTPAEFTRFVRSEIESAARVVKAAGIKPQ